MDNLTVENIPDDPETVLAQARAIHELLAGIIQLTPDEMEQAINEGRP